MADYVRYPAGEVNIYRFMPELKREVYHQIAECCWAITVGTTVGYSYYRDSGNLNFEVSPQDILDRVWHYSTTEEKMARGEHQDEWGGYLCSHHIAYNYVSSRGASLQTNYPFENRLNWDKGPVPDTEVPRIYCSPYERLDLAGAVAAASNGIPVTAAVEITDAFKGIYKETPGAKSCGTHSVLIVGVNIEQQYFRIRNSWGVGWGDHGYGLVHFNSIQRFSCV